MKNQSKQHAHSRLVLLFVTVAVFDLFDEPQFPTLAGK